MPTPATIRAAMGAALERIPKLVVHANLTEVATAGDFGIAVVGGPTADYEAAQGRGNTDWSYPIYLVVPTTNYDAATEILDELVSPFGERSVIQLFWDYGRAKGSLGQGLGIVDSNGNVDLDAHISELTAYGITFDVVGIPHLAAVLTCVVHAPGYPT